MPDITLPSAVVVGDPVEASGFNTAVDAIEEINDALNLVTGRGILNSSFEELLTSWVVAAGTGGTITAVTSPNIEGEGAAKFTRTIGAGNSGGTLTSEDFIIVAPGTGRLRFGLSHDAVIKSSVEATFYNDDTTAVVSTIVIGTVDDLETAMRQIEFDDFDIPSGARWMKFQLKGAFEATAGDNAGSAVFDAVVYNQQTVNNPELSGTKYSIPDPLNTFATYETIELAIHELCDTLTIQNIALDAADNGTGGSCRIKIGANLGTAVTFTSVFTGTIDITLTGLIGLGIAGTTASVEIQGEKDANAAIAKFTVATNFTNGFENNIVMVD